ncbi:chromate transporter [Paenibacillus sp. UNCCL117]|uniref:chromate transporter n=1 Tax=unclassified Paenibacillus TaxID=185978 RepID=UPI000887C7CD|nr:MULTISPECIES: chromate transporter [unclassified Paenibacillus]SDE20369.1 chromate transporter [Paenibacillus sp. cl123]SFW61774.1 chromate transporter [Paenibacillus sp. UNCCL117]
MIYFELFATFLMIGFVSFGGGYAMIPVIERQVTGKGWMSIQEFTDVIAVAGMSPGPMGTNSAIFVGYQTAGIGGAGFAAAGMVLPSLLIVIAVGYGFSKIDKNRWVQYALYGLRPIITGLIFYGAIRFAVSNHMIDSLDMRTLGSLLFFLGALAALLRFRMHPFQVIVISGLTGAAVYS